MNSHRLSYLISSLASDVFSAYLKAPTFKSGQSPQQIWEQKVFCILSSQFNARKSAEIARHLVCTVPFFEVGPTVREVESECLRLLTAPGYRHRFPNSRAQQIALSWFPFSQISDRYYEYIKSWGPEAQARKEIVSNFPGIGLKQASMFLRNIGVSKSLAVVDVHILAYLKACHGWETRELNAYTYASAEDIMLREADALGLELNVFDTIVWTAVRAVKNCEASCMTQYV